MAAAPKPRTWAGSYNVTAEVAFARLSNTYMFKLDGEPGSRAFDVGLFSTLEPGPLTNPVTDQGRRFRIDVIVTELPRRKKKPRKNPW